MVMTSAQWTSLIAHVQDSISGNLELQHELGWSGNTWTCYIPNLKNTLSFHEYYQRWTLAIKAAGPVEGVEGMNPLQFENAILALFRLIHDRPNGEYTQAQAWERQLRDEREAQRQAAQSSFLNSL